MAYYPINFIPFQFENSSGLPASGYVLKAYDAASPASTIAMAIDSSGTPTVATITLNSNGYPSVSGNVVIPYLDRDYNLSLYPSQSAADSNTGAIWTVEDKSPITISNLDDAAITGNATAENLTVSGIARFNADVIIIDSINDANSNELIKFGTTAAAVNEITVANAATGNNPSLSASGSDTNVGMDFQAKGTGVFNFKGTSSGPAEIRLFEDTDNGTNYIGLKAPANISSNQTYELPIYGGFGFSGLKVLVTSDTATTITANEILLRDSNNVGFLATSVNVSNAITTSGANGLDTGSEASNTWYNVYVIYNPSTATTASLISTSATAPTLPSGYTFKARVGAIRNNNSSNLYRTIQYGRKAQYIVGTNPSVFISMASGTAGSVSTPTWSSILATGYVPPTASTIGGTLFMTNSTAIVAPNNSYDQIASTTSPPPASIVVSSQSGSLPFEFVLESTSIYWASNGASNAIYCRGWEDNL